MRLLIDVGSCFKMLGGWFECLFMYSGLAIMKNKSARLAEKTRKELHKCFEQFGLKNTAEANLHVVNFLDVTFHLNIYTLLHLGVVEHSVRRASGCSFAILQSPRPLWSLEHSGPMTLCAACVW